MHTSSVKNLSIISAMVLALAGATLVLGRSNVCVVEDTWQFIGPDEIDAIDMYATACHPRYSNAASKIKHYYVVALRPITEPRPKNDGYNEADVVFEIEKTSEETQLSFGSLASYLPPDHPSRADQEKVLVIGCYQCSPSHVRKKLHSWNGQAMRYAFSDHATPRPVIE